MMHRHALRVTTVATTLLLALAMLPLGSAHQAGVPDGYTRYAHDCADDYGPHGVGVSTQTAHDGIAIDIVEKIRAADMLVYIRISLGVKEDSNSDPTRETLTFVSPGLEDVVKTTVDSTDEEDLSLVTGETTVTPEHISGPLPVYYTTDSGGGTDEGRFSYELGYSYEALNVTRGQELTEFQVVTLKQGALDSGFVKADHLPGGTYSGGEYEAGCEADGGDDDYFVAAGYTLQKGPMPEEEDEDDGNQGGDGGMPQADFTFTPERPRQGEAVSFSDTSADPDGAIASWAWEFGDGQTSSDQNPTHTYAMARTYVVKLTVTDDEGNTDTTSKDLRFENQRPIARFSAAPGEATAGTEITFTDESTDADGSIAVRDWEFGDGNTARGANVTHTYTEAGTYTVTLTVTDNADSRSRTTETVVITAEADDAEAPGPALLLLVLGLTALLSLLRRRD